MNLERRVAQFNRIFGSELGYRGAEPRYAWKRASELHYLMQEGFRRASTVVIGPVVPNYVRYCWDERLGNVWVLAKYDYPRTTTKWDAPIMREYDWHEQFGDAFPYPDKGQYYAITDTALLPDEVPTEDETRILIAVIRGKEALEYEAFKKELAAAAQKSVDTAISDAHDMIDSDWPAFDNALATEDKLGQSRGGSVSFGGIGEKTT